MKKNFGNKNWMFPMPVLMIGTYGEDGTPDVMNAAWGGISLEDEITICIDSSHKTWANIAAKKAFTVAFGTAETAVQCDYLGIVSGNQTPGKVKKSGFTLTKSEFVDAPVINELPLVLECKLISMNESNCNVVGKILNRADRRETRRRQNEADLLRYLRARLQDHGRKGRPCFLGRKRADVKERGVDNERNCRFLGWFPGAFCDHMADAQAI